MALITTENAPVLQSLFNDVALDKPQIGDAARVMTGKHTGAIGIVRHHMVSRFKRPFRYGSELSHMMTQARGRHGYIVRLETEDGESFWADASQIMLCKGGLA